MNKMITFFLLIFIRIGICQQLPAGLELPPHWDKLYEVISYDNGALTYKAIQSGLTQIKQIAPPVSPSLYTLLDTIYADTVYTFRVWEIDTSLYTDMFLKMGTAPVNNRSYDMLLTDSDGNLRNEIIGIYNPNDGLNFLPTFYNEWNPATRLFDQVVDFNPTPGTGVGISVLSGDVDQDGRKEIYYQRGHWIRAYESSDSSQYATEFRFRHEPFEGIVPSGYAMADFDLDNQMELAFIRVMMDSAGVYRNACIIRENTGCDTCFTETAIVIMPNSAGTTRFAVGDLNRNGKPEIFGGGLFGLMSAIESVADDSFSVIWQGQLPTFNADYHLVTDDLNNNGKPELWAGGGYGVSLTRNLVTVFESDDQGGYLPVSAVEIQGGNGLYIWQIIAADFDGDHHDEVVIDVGGTVMMFQLNSRNEILLKWATFVEFDYGIGAGDVDGDGIAELVIAENIRDGNTVITQSTVYKWKFPVGIDVSNEKRISDITLSAYPNPFNPATTIAFILPQPATVQLDIFDLNGRLVTTIADGSFGVGRHQATWDGSNTNGEPVASGVYFCRLSATGSLTGAGAVYTQTRKMLLMR